MIKVSKEVRGWCWLALLVASVLCVVSATDAGSVEYGVFRTNGLVDRAADRVASVAQRVATRVGAQSAGGYGTPASYSPAWGSARAGYASNGGYGAATIGTQSSGGYGFLGRWRASRQAQAAAGICPDCGGVRSTGYGSAGG